MNNGLWRFGEMNPFYVYYDLFNFTLVFSFHNEEGKITIPMPLGKQPVTSHFMIHVTFRTPLILVFTTAPMWLRPPFANLGPPPLEVYILHIYYQESSHFGSFSCMGPMLPKVIQNPKDPSLIFFI